MWKRPSGCASHSTISTSVPSLSGTPSDPPWGIIPRRRLPIMTRRTRRRYRGSKMLSAWRCPGKTDVITKSGSTRRCPGVLPGAVCGAVLSSAARARHSSGKCLRRMLFRVWLVAISPAK